MTRTVAQKMGIKAGSRAYFANADNDAIDNIDLPDLDSSIRLNHEFDYIHLFVKQQSEFIDLFPKLKRHLRS